MNNHKYRLMKDRNTFYIDVSYGHYRRTDRSSNIEVVIGIFKQSKNFTMSIATVNYDKVYNSEILLEFIDVNDIYEKFPEFFI